MLTTLGTNGKSIHAQGGAGGVRRKKDRFELLRMASSLLYRKDAAPKQQHPTVWCNRGITTGTDQAGVWRAVDGSNARLSGVITCGAVWTCPVCAAKISEERRKDLSAAMAGHVAAGGHAYLLTLTFPHESDMPLGELLEKFAKARQSWANSRTYKRIMGEKGDRGTAGRLGTVNALEVTVGKANGWHPHVHALVFAVPGAFGEGEPINPAGDLASGAIDELKGAWVKALQKAGLCDGTQVSDVFRHGLNVRGGAKAAEYIAKFGKDERWGASSELTRNHAKVGTVGEIAGDMHFTPFQLLQFVISGDGWAAARFREYAEAFFGRRMLSWSPGLRKALRLADDRDDEEIAADDRPAPEEEQVGTISIEDLSALISRNMLGDFHRYVAESCIHPDRAQQDIDDYLRMVKAMPKFGRGQVLKRATFDKNERHRTVEPVEYRDAA